VTRIVGGGFDTFSDERFYSYRRDRETGRFASLVWIEPARVKAEAPTKASSEAPVAVAAEPAFARA
jgi:hypothetical protein